MADRTVSDVLTERNFVSDVGQSDEETERSLAVMHPDVADDYREARRIRTKTRARSPRKTCGRPSANTARSTSGSCGDTEVIGGTAWKRWLPDSDDYILRANFSRSRPRSETDLAVRITIAGK
jgi:hypothetical protein